MSGRMGSAALRLKSIADRIEDVAVESAPGLERIEIRGSAHRLVGILAIRPAEGIHQLERLALRGNPEQEERVHLDGEGAADRGEQEPGDPLVRERDVHERDGAEEK